MNRDKVFRSIAALLLALSICLLLFPWGCAKHPAQKKTPTSAAGINSIEGGPDLPLGMPTDNKPPETQK
jgi:hypothetical protein